jgi:hypothetical protein
MTEKYSSIDSDGFAIVDVVGRNGKPGSHEPVETSSALRESQGFRLKANLWAKNVKSFEHDLIGSALSAGYCPSPVESHDSRSSEQESNEHRNA